MMPAVPCFRSLAGPAAVATACSRRPQSLSPLLAVGLNPAWQKTLVFDDLALDRVNRATRMATGVGGKAGNLARALGALGVEVVVAHFVGGSTGDLVASALEAMGVGQLSVRTRSETRVCTTLLCSGRPGEMTEVIEPSGPVTEEECGRMRQLLDARIPACRGVAVCGTFPPGVPPSLLADSVSRAVRRDCTVVLDGYRQVDRVLEAGVHVLKINANELRQLGGADDLVAAARACLRAYPLQVVVATDGGGPAFACDRQRAYWFDLPRLRILNPLGAGDCVTGTLLHYLTASGHRRPGLVETVRGALACGVASCLTSSPGSFDPDEAGALAGRIDVRQLDPERWPPLSDDGGTGG